MTGKSDFTEEEWKLVVEAPPSAGLLGIAAHRGGSIRETLSMAKTYLSMAKTYRRRGRGTGRVSSWTSSSRPKPEMDHTRYKSPEGLKQACLKHITDAVERRSRMTQAAELSAPGGPATQPNTILVGD